LQGDLGLRSCRAGYYAVLYDPTRRVAHADVPCREDSRPGREDTMPPADRAKGIPTARSIHHVAFTVPDLEQAIAFFRDVLGCELAYRAGPFSDPDGDWMATNLDVHREAVLHLAVLRAGPTTNIELLEFQSPDRTETMPRNDAVGGHHLAIYVDDVAAAAEYLRAVEGVRILGEATLVGPPHANAGATLLYFQSPWGLTLELISFPAGMGYEASADVLANGPAPAWSA
jgi:catechol 2,3-dioxygenase-like lactoylglutathione lyase family enzyme